MSVDSTTIDRIVQNVLRQLGAPGSHGAIADKASSAAAVRPQGQGRGGVAAATAASHGAVAVRGGANGFAITEHVVTAAVLEPHAARGATITIPKQAVVTPSARDLIRERGLQIERGAGSAQSGGGVKDASGGDYPRAEAGLASWLVIVRNTEAVERLWQDLHLTWQRELCGCPDDAAGVAIREVSRGAAGQVIVFAEESHRTACLANRNESVQAAAVRDAGDVADVRRQLRANVWCVDPSGKSWFELRNVLRAIGASGVRS